MLRKVSRGVKETLWAQRPVLGARHTEDNPANGRSCCSGTSAQGGFARLLVCSGRSRRASSPPSSMRGNNVAASVWRTAIV